MINVLIVDDDPMVAELNKYYLSQVGGFHCQATVATLSQARAAGRCRRQHRFGAVGYLHAAGERAGSAARPARARREDRRDHHLLRQRREHGAKALHYGVVDYLIKPFQFSRFKEALSHYRQQSQLLAQREFSQADVDSLLRRQPGGQESKSCRRA